jgi:hypothetical protein
MRVLQVGRGLLVGSALVMGSAACDTSVEEADTSSTGAGSTSGTSDATPEFVAGQGQAQEGAAYPVGPFGFKTGAIIQNFKFWGYPNAVADNTQTVLIELADFYNPTGDGVFPEGSPYGAGEAKPKALEIDVASVWCGPCNQEAATELPPRYAKYKALGGEIFSVLADGPTPGIPATPTHLKNWSTKYKTNYPLATDPSYALEALFAQEAFPQNFIIDTRTMAIVKVIAGVPDATFWSKFESVLAQ